MRIILADEYKSLKPFESDELNPLTIITGKNGSGKSQLLQLVAKKNQRDPSVVSTRFEFQPAINKIQTEGLVKGDAKRIGHDQWKAIVQTQLNAFKQLTPSTRTLISYIFKNNLEEAAFSKRTGRDLLTDEIEYRSLVAKAYAEHNGQLLETTKVSYSIERQLLQQVFNPQRAALLKFVNELCMYTGKNQTELNDSDFFNTPIEEHIIDNSDLFSSQIELIFYNYARRRDLNRRTFFDKTIDHIENNSISDEMFTTKFVPPWVLINKILTAHDVDFYFKGIDKREFTPDVALDFTLYKKSNNLAIPFGDLSSGEKVIIGLILKLFTSQYYADNLSFPDLFILDEPDAHLHPEMSKLLLDVLRDTFVKKFNIRVILTTHSPSTIALADDECVYQLRNGDDSGLKKVSKDDALKLLTSFIPTLSIDYKNHKQVFVESPTDVFYYQSLHDKHLQVKPQLYRLYFISNAPGKSNCSQVYSIVNEIRKSGNSTAYGIVDWDKTNKPESNIFVHGENERYSVENFILDPIYIICLLIDLKNAHGICDKIGFDKNNNQYLIGQEPAERLQAFVDWFFRAFEEKFPIYKCDGGKVSIEYNNGRTLQIPQWYLEMQGHEIVTKVKTVFPALDKYTSEGMLQKELTTILNKCYPFVPATTIRLIEHI
jgi:AAA15 family ATPase/GTPase